MRHYDCWRTYAYSNQVVLALANKRRRLASANRRVQTKIEHLRAMLRIQDARIRELETSILEEQESTNAFQEQVQKVNDRLIRVVREVRH